MTESEFRRLPKADRQTMPTDELMGIILKTHDELTENLTLEGWEYVAPGEDSEPDDPSEIWRREIGGVIEWADVFRIDDPPEDEPERCWLVAPSPIDPRLIEH